jgi:hypothetical protein
MHPGCYRRGALSRNIACTPQAFLAAVKAYREELVAAVECMFT